MNLTPEQIRLLRLRSQSLHPETALSITSVAQLLSVLCGLQSQELPSATLGVRARSYNLVEEDVRRAREVERSIVLTWCMRGTLHLVAAHDLGWLLPLFGPTFIRKTEGRYRQLGLSPDIRTKAAGLIQEVLARRGPLTRAELAKELVAKGIPVEGQAIAHLVRYTALQGVICFGPQRNGKLTYVLLEDWIKLEEGLNPERVMAELAHRYLKAYGPAAPEDLASWAGITLQQARAGFNAISSDLIEFHDPPLWMLRQHAAWIDKPLDEPILRLLPRYDTYLLGYQNREFMVSEAYAKRVHPGGGLIKPTLILDGRAVGIWWVERRKSVSTIVIEPFEALPDDKLSGLESEVRDIGRFLGDEFGLRVENP